MLFYSKLFELFFVFCEKKRNCQKKNSVDWLLSFFNKKKRLCNWRRLEETSFFFFHLFFSTEALYAIVARTSCFFFLYFSYKHMYLVWALKHKKNNKSFFYFPFHSRTNNFFFLLLFFLTKPIKKAIVKNLKKSIYFHVWFFTTLNCKKGGHTATWNFTTSFYYTLSLIK